MPIEVSGFVNISDRLKELGCVYPQSGMALLPVNIETAKSADELKQASEAATIRKLLKAGQLPLVDIMSAGQHLPAIKNKHLEWTAPILFISYALYSGDSPMLTVALNIISNAAYDFFKGMGRPHRVKLDVVTEIDPEKTTRRITYEGPVEGLKELPKAIREALK